LNVETVEVEVETLVSVRRIVRTLPLLTASGIV
jgi:hypothetical protein